MPVIRIQAKIKRSHNFVTVKLACEAKLKMEGNILKGFEFPLEVLIGWDSPWEQEVIIPASIKAISPDAFREDKTILHLSLQHQYLELGQSAFYGCRNLKTAALPEGTKTVPAGAFGDCPALEKVRIPNSVERIQKNAFKNCFSLKKLKLPAGLQVIEKYAFSGCRNLEELILPPGLTEIGCEAFAGCTGLKKIILPESLSSIDNRAFQNCISLEEIVIPTGVTQLPHGVFGGCKNLRRVVLPDTLKSISPYAFWNSRNVEVVEHPNSVFYAQMFLDTPWFEQQPPLVEPVKPLPLHLADSIGAVGGAMLCAMGHPWFEKGKEYRFHICEKYPWVIEVTSRYADPDHPFDFRNDWMLMTTDLEPIEGVNTCFAVTDSELKDKESIHAWEISEAARRLDPEKRELYDEAYRYRGSQGNR